MCRTTSRALLDELDSLSAQKVQLESYAVALPRGHQEYYGTYNGYMFQAAYSTYNESYSKTLYSNRNLPPQIQNRATKQA